MSLLCQLWSLHESIQDYKTVLETASLSSMDFDSELEGSMTGSINSIQSINSPMSPVTPHHPLSYNPMNTLWWWWCGFNLDQYFVKVSSDYCFYNLHSKIIMTCLKWLITVHSYFVAPSLSTYSNKYLISPYLFYLFIFIYNIRWTCQANPILIWQ